MTMVAREIRVPGELEQEIAREADEQGMTWADLSEELLTESIKTRRAPGIVFMDGPSGRRATVAGTGLDVWELIATWKACGQRDEALVESYPWLSESQRRAALSYYRLYPQEVEDRLRREETWTPERVRQELPFSVPKKK